MGSSDPRRLVGLPRSPLAPCLRAAAVITALILAPGSSHGAIGPTVALVKSSSLAQFETASTAIVDTLRRNPLQPEILTFDLEGDQGNATSILPAVHRTNPSLIVTVGTLATTVVLGDPSPIPVVFSMVLYPDASGFTGTKARAVTGVSLDLPFDLQFDYMRRLLPAVHRIGVLFHPAETGAIIARARAVALRYQFTLVEKAVAEPGTAVSALDDLMQSVEGIWAVADSHVLTAQTTPALILAALRHRVPFIGLSTAHVRAGALAALYCDYADIGRQTADVAGRILAGADPASIAVVTPRKIALALNHLTAEHLGVAVPPELKSEAGMNVP